MLRMYILLPFSELGSAGRVERVKNEPLSIILPNRVHSLLLKLISDGIGS